MFEIYKSNAIPLVLLNYAQGTATTEHLSRYGLEDTEKAVIEGVCDEQTKKTLFKAAKRRMFVDIPGNGIMLAIPLKSVGGGKTLSYLTGGKASDGGKPDMNFDNELIVVVLNEGYSDTVMDAARSAGARGGTVLHAKGTGAGMTERFHGVSIAEEKDMIYIVSPKDEKSAIMKAIADSAGTGTRAGAFCFSLPVSEVAGIRTEVED